MFAPFVQPCLQIHLLALFLLFCTLHCEDQHLKAIDGQPQNWTQAIHTCLTNGLQVVQPSSANKSQQLEAEYFSATNFINLNISWVWIGLKYDTQTKTYYWEDGTSMAWSNWGQDQPDTDKQDSFLCAKLQIEEGFYWAIENCSLSYQVLCENPEKILPINETNEDDVKIIVNNITTVVPLNVTTLDTSEDSTVKDENVLWPTDDIPVMITLGLGILLTIVLIVLGYAAWTCFLQNLVEGRPSKRRSQYSNEHSPLQDFG